MKCIELIGGASPAKSKAGKDISLIVTDEKDTAVQARKKKCVAIDPGHQRKGSPVLEAIGPGSSRTIKVADGTVGLYSGLAEYKLHLKVGLLLRDDLEKRGYKVMMTQIQ